MPWPHTKALVVLPQEEQKIAPSLNPVPAQDNSYTTPHPSFQSPIPNRYELLMLMKTELFKSSTNIKGLFQQDHSSAQCSFL